ncbi:MAG TPA: YigZ family protein [Saprospiraceae bacterium]|nr:YigZ family protein [Saprospiraceae bacterium]
MVDEFLTLANSSEGYYMDRGSKFLAYAFPVSDELQASQFLQKIKKDHPKARHYCSALRLLPDGSFERVNDDGEPSGSAGKPMLGQLIKNDLTNVLVIVVRYFGGTKLGVPGLIEAYKTSTSNAIQTGSIVKKYVFTTIRLDMSYEQLPLWVNHFRQHGIPIFKEEYNEGASLFLGFKRSTHLNDLKGTFREYSQHDFAELRDYSKHLNIIITFLNDEHIL